LAKPGGVGDTKARRNV